MEKNRIDLCGKKILCMYEGNAEKAILNILLDNSLLIFDRKMLIKGKPVRRERVNIIEKKYLSDDFRCQIVIIRVIDSKNEKFKLSKLYVNKVDSIINTITSPEIEILTVIADDNYDRYCSSNYSKPSLYCKAEYKNIKIKSEEFIEKRFSDPLVLVGAIKKHKKSIGKDNLTLFDLLI
ncbi:MAG: hypothetical protein GX078_05430 [Clostridiales bacterium]|nr:hypothetical protein [Clostridiales bacterium]